MAKADPNLYCQTDLENAEPRIVNGVPKTCVLNLGNGLMLQIVPGKLIDDQYSASKSWLWRYSRDGIEHRLGLGSFDKIPLARARVKAEALQDQLDRGIDKEEQKAERRRSQRPKISSRTFRECTAEYVAARDRPWRSSHPYVTTLGREPAILRAKCATAVNRIANAVVV
jgi:hypothetical protein